MPFRRPLTAENAVVLGNVLRPPPDVAVCRVHKVVDFFRLDQIIGHFDIGIDERNKQRKDCQELHGYCTKLCALLVTAPRYSVINDEKGL